MTSSLAPTDAYPDFKNLTSTYPGLTQEMLDYEIQVIRATCQLSVVSSTPTAPAHGLLKSESFCT